MNPHLDIRRRSSWLFSPATLCRWGELCLVIGIVALYPAVRFCWKHYGLVLHEQEPPWWYTPTVAAATVWIPFMLALTGLAAVLVGCVGQLIEKASGRQYEQRLATRERMQPGEPPG